MRAVTLLLTVGLAACTTTTDTAVPTTAVEPPPAAGSVDSLQGSALAEGLTPIEALGPPSVGAGEVPVFRWRPVEGAVVYDLVVTGPDGPIWAWQGEATEVALGGLPDERPPGLAGPVIRAGSCWSVVAWGSEGHVIGASGLIPVSPGEVTSPCQPGATGAPG